MRQARKGTCGACKLMQAGPVASLPAMRRGSFMLVMLTLTQPQLQDIVDGTMPVGRHTGVDMRVQCWGAGAPAPGAAGGLRRRAARSSRLRTLPRVSPPCAQSLTLMINWESNNRD